MAIQANPPITRAKELLHRLGSLEEVCRYYEALEKANRDEASRLATAWEEGWEKGRKKAFNEQIARNMLIKGLPDDLIIEITELTPEELTKLKATFSSD
jgi:predicted transposase/invertase (TIGR01784 family)